MEASASRLAWFTAIVFGMISPMKSTRSESTIMAVERLWVGISLAKRRVAVTDVATLTRVFPKRMVESSSRGRCNALTMSFALLDFIFPRRRRSMRSRQKKAVSVAEKQAEQTSKTARSPIRNSVPDKKSSNSGFKYNS